MWISLDTVLFMILCGVRHTIMDASDTTQLLKNYHFVTFYYASNKLVNRVYPISHFEFSTCSNYFKMKYSSSTGNTTFHMSTPAEFGRTWVQNWNHTKLKQLLMALTVLWDWLCFICLWLNSLLILLCLFLFCTIELKRVSVIKQRKKSIFHLFGQTPVLCPTVI